MIRKMQSKRFKGQERCYKDWYKRAGRANERGCRSFARYRKTKIWSAKRKYKNEKDAKKLK